MEKAPYKYIALPFCSILKTDLECLITQHAYGSSECKQEGVYLLPLAPSAAARTVSAEVCTKPYLYTVCRCNCLCIHMQIHLL